MNVFYFIIYYCDYFGSASCLATSLPVSGLFIGPFSLVFALFSKCPSPLRPYFDIKTTQPEP